MSRVVIGLLCFLFFSKLYAQCDLIRSVQKAEPIIADCWQQHIENFGTNADRVESQIKNWGAEIRKSQASKSQKLKYFEQLIENLRDVKHSANLIPIAYYEKGKWLYSPQVDDLPAAIDVFSEAIEIEKSNPVIDSFFVSKCLTALGLSQFYHGNLISSEQTMLEQVKTVWPKSPNSHAGVLQTLGLIYQAKGNVILAEQHFYQSGTKYIKVHDDSLYFVRYGLNSIGLLYTDYSNFDRAISAYEQALEIISRSKKNSEFGEYLSTNIRGNLASIYSYSNKFDDALREYHNILRTYKENNLIQDVMLTIFNIGTINIRKKQLILAEKYYMQVDSLLAIHNYATLEKLMVDNKAYLMRAQGDYQLAIEARRRQLENNCQFKFEECLTTNWNKIESSKLVSLSKIFPKISLVYRDRYRSHNSQNDLDSTLLMFRVTQNILDQIKLNQLDPDFSTDLSALNTDLLEDVLSLSSDKPEWADRYYNFFEKAKSASLLASIQSSDSESLFRNKYPEINKAHQLKLAIDSIQDLLDKPEGSSITDRHREEILQLNQKLLHANEAKQKLLISQNELTNLYEHVALEELQKSLDNESSMLSYFINQAKDELFILFITSDHIELFNKKVYGQFTEDVFRLINMPTKSDEEKAAWIESNNRLSELLFGDLLTKTPIELKIIPDGILAYLPFEMLFSENAKITDSYKKLPYLIKEKNISYNFSASIWKEMSDKENSGRGMLSMAPEFSLKSGIGNANRESAVPLAHAKKEVQAINAIYKNKFQPESKDDFIRDAAQAQIVHFAGHAILNDNKPENSYLAFSSADNREDKLYIREIYNIRTPSELVVLSACNTGQGELKKGEGVMSMARAFAYAGAKSLVYSLWDVNDGSTKKIMERFYQELKAGACKDEALRTAKLAYMDKARGALQQPYYWAGFVAMGDMDPIQTGYANYWLYGLALILILSVVFYFLRHRFRS